MTRTFLIIWMIAMSGYFTDLAAKVLSFEEEKKENEAYQNNPYEISQEDVEWMLNATIQQLKGCRVKGAGDMWIYTPDGVGNYKALWTKGGALFYTTLKIFSTN